MSELPKGWVEATLGEVADVRLGRQRSPDKHTGVHPRPYLRAANVTWDGLDLSDVNQMDFTDDEVAVYALRSGDVLLNEASGSPKEVGKAALYSGEIENCCFQNTLIRVRPGEAMLPEYICHRLLNDARAGRFVEHGRGVGINHLGSATVQTWPVELPPMPEQRRIVAKLDELLARSRRAREELAAVPALLERYRQSVLAAAFRGDLTADWRAKNPDVEPASELLKRIRVERRRRWEDAELARLTAKGKAPSDERWRERYEEPSEPDRDRLTQLPETWVWASMEAVGDIHLGRQRAPQYQTGDHSHPYLRVANIKDDYIDVSNVNTMDFDREDFAHYRLVPDDVLLSEGQSPELVGQSAIYEGGIDGLCFQKTLHRFRRFGSAPSARFAQLVFRHYVKNGIFRSVASLTVNIAHLTLVRLKPLAFPLPPGPEQEVIQERLLGAMRTVDRLELLARDGLERVEAAERAILTRAFRGELVPQDPADEPASVLLERIRAERAAAPVKKKSGRQPRREG